MSAEAPKTPEEWRALVLSFIASLTLNDTVGDTADDIATVLKRIGWEGEAEDAADLRRALGRQGVTTLHGTAIGGEDGA